MFRYYGVPYGGETVTAQGGVSQGGTRGTVQGERHRHGCRRRHRASQRAGDAMTRSEQRVAVDKTAEPVGR